MSLGFQKNLFGLAMLALLTHCSAQQKRVDQPNPARANSIGEAVKMYQTETRNSVSPASVRTSASPVKGEVTMVPALQQDRCEQYVQAFIQSTETEPTTAVLGFFNAGVASQDCGNMDRAEGLYQQSLQKDPGFIPALVNLAVLYREKGKPDVAVGYLEKAIATKTRPGDREDVVAQYRLLAYFETASLSYEKWKQTKQNTSQNTSSLDDVFANIQRVLAIDPHYMPGYLLLSSIYYETAGTDRAKLNLALVTCEQGLMDNPNYARLHNLRGLIRLAQKQVSTALQDFRKAVEIDPGLAEGWMNMGTVFLNARSYQEAEKSFSTVLSKNPNNVDAMIGIGIALRGQKNVKGAEDWYKKALTTSPDLCGPLYNLGLLKQDHGSTLPDELVQAKQYYQRYASCGKADPALVADALTRIKDIETLQRIQKELEAAAGTPAAVPAEKK